MAMFSAIDKPFGGKVGEKKVGQRVYYFGSISSCIVVLGSMLTEKPQSQSKIANLFAPIQRRGHRRPIAVRRWRVRN